MMRAFTQIAAALSIVGCSNAIGHDSAEPSSKGTCGGTSAESLMWVVDSLRFARIEDGVSDGFDLDGEVSSTGGPSGCGRDDWTSPAGVAGIDNAFGELIPALENTEFIAAEALINDTIRTGELMLLTGVDNVDDRENDGCVGMQLSRATGTPMLATDGSILAGQTLSSDPDFEPIHLSDLSLEQGSVGGRPVTATLPVQVLDAALEFRLLEGGLRVDQLEDGHARGVLAGGLDIAEVLAIARRQNVADEVGDLLESLLGVVADLAPNAEGECTQLSVTFEYTATPVYLFDAG